CLAELGGSVTRITTLEDNSAKIDPVVLVTKVAVIASASGNGKTTLGRDLGLARSSYSHLGATPRSAHLAARSQPGVALERQPGVARFSVLGPRLACPVGTALALPPSPRIPAGALAPARNPPDHLHRGLAVPL